MESKEKKLLDKLLTNTSFSKTEIKKLLSVYADTVGGYGVEVDMMDRKIFKQFFHASFDIAEDILVDQIFVYFNQDEDIEDTNITREEWIMGFNVFLKGSEEEQAQYCFNIYDLNCDGYISKEEMVVLLRGSMGIEQDSEEDVKV